MLSDALTYVFWGNTVGSYLLAGAGVVVAVVIIRILGLFVVRRIAAWANRTKAPIDEKLVKSTARALRPLIYLGVVYLAVRTLTFSAKVLSFVDIGGKVILVLLIARFTTTAIVNILRYYWLFKGRDEARENTVKALVPIIAVAVWTVAVIFLLDNLGFKVSTVVAGLGIGGVAAALAGQAILKDLFSYFAMLFDRPFEIGDFIAFGDKMGTVERIGLKTTRLRSLSGEQLVVSNADLTDSRVQNFKRMDRRRVAFNVNVTYETPAAKLAEIPAVIEGIVTAVEGATFERAHFSKYGEYSLVFETVYYVEDSDYRKYMDIQQRINLEIYEAFKARRISFAYPTRTVYLPPAKARTAKR